MFSIPDETQVRIIKEVLCKTSPNGNAGLYNIIAGEKYHYELISRETLTYRVYRGYIHGDETYEKYHDISIETFRTYFKPNETHC